MIRLAASMGDGSAMWPKGISSISECPVDLVMAVAHANTILRAQENLMEDEQPPMWKWAFDEEISAHMERVKTKRAERYGGNSSSRGDEHEEPPNGWAQNEYARNLR